MKRPIVNDTGSSEEFQTLSTDPDQTDYHLLSNNTSLIKRKFVPKTTGYKENIISKNAIINKSNNKRKTNKPKQCRRFITEISKLQHSDKNVIPRAPFGRLVQQILQKHCELQVTYGFLDAIHEASEIYLVQLLNDARRCCSHRNCKTVSVIDLQLALYVRGLFDPGVN